METLKSVLPTATVLAVSYGIMEVVHHTFIEGMFIPWLMSLGMSASVVTGLSIATGVVSIIALAFLVTKTVSWINSIEKKTVIAV